LLANTYHKHLSFSPLAYLTVLYKQELQACIWTVSSSMMVWLCD